MKLSEIGGALAGIQTGLDNAKTTITERLNKVKTEITTKIAELQEAIDNNQNADLPDDIVTAINNLKTSAEGITSAVEDSVAAVDDVVPDAVTPEAPVDELPKSPSASPSENQGLRAKSASKSSKRS